MSDSNSNGGGGGGGEEKLIAVARHIAKTLGHSDSMTDDILQIFSTFDGRFSREKLSDHHPAMFSGERERDPSSSLDACLREISHYLSSDRPLWLDPASGAAFLDAVDYLLAAVREFGPLSHENKTLAVALDRADDLVQQSIFRLEDEFRGLIIRATDSFDSRSLEPSDSDDEDAGGSLPVAEPVTDLNIIIDALPSATINELNEIAKRMITVDYGRECSHAYSACRREFIEESLSRLGLQKLSTEEVQKLPWSDLEDEIERWCNSAVFSLRILFPSERRLCDRVFVGFPSTADFSFMEVCRGSAIQLLNFADAVAISSRSPERLFKVLDVYETLRDLMPEFELLFSDQYCVFLRNEAMTIWRRVGEAIRGIFMELENLIRRDPAKTPVPGGALHPITRYVMNYLRAACKSQPTLEQVFEEERERALGPTGSLPVQMAWIMELLESNLEAKSKIYRDAALSSVFMMNNGRYIVQKVKDNELGVLLGDDWIRKHSAKIRQFQVNYLRSSWNKLVGVLKMENGNAGDLNARPMKERLKMFNSHFDEIVKAQSTWIICDEQLREDLMTSISGHLLPAYRKFIEKFQSSPEAGRNPEKHIKYSTEDVEDRINKEVFQGNSGSR